MASVSIDLWYAALASPAGIIVQCDDPEATKQKLYRLRAGANDPDLNHISIVQSPTSPSDLWLVKKDRK